MNFNSVSSAYTPFQACLREVMRLGAQMRSNRTEKSYQKMVARVDQFTPFPEPPEVMQVEILTLLGLKGIDNEKFMKSTLQKAIQCFCNLTPSLSCLVSSYLCNDEKPEFAYQFPEEIRIPDVKLAMVLTNLNNLHKLTDMFMVYTSFQETLLKVVNDAEALYSRCRQIEHWEENDQPGWLVQRSRCLTDQFDRFIDHIMRFIPYPFAPEPVQKEILGLLKVEHLSKKKLHNDEIVRLHGWLYHGPKHHYYKGNLKLLTEMMASVFPQETDFEAMSIKMLLVNLQHENR